MHESSFSLTHKHFLKAQNTLNYCRTFSFHNHERNQPHLMQDRAWMVECDLHNRRTAGSQIISHSSEPTMKSWNNG